MYNKPFAGKRIDYIVNLIQPRKSMRILNIGISNIPRIEMILENKVKECVTLDFDDDKMKKASRYLKKTKLIKADITKELKLRKNYFDAIVILEVLEHVDHDAQVVKNLRSLLKDGGKMIIGVPNNALLHYINPVKYAEHKRHYSNEEAIRLLESNGFKVDHFNLVESWTLLLNLYIHLFSKFVLRKTIPFNTFNKRADRTYGQFNTHGLDIILRAKKI